MASAPDPCPANDGCKNDVKPKVRPISIVVMSHDVSACLAQYCFDDCDPCQRERERGRWKLKKMKEEEEEGDVLWRVGK